MEFWSICSFKLIELNKQVGEFELGLIIKKETLRVKSGIDEPLCVKLTG